MIENGKISPSITTINKYCLFATINPHDIGTFELSQPFLDRFGISVPISMPGSHDLQLILTGKDEKYSGYDEQTLLNKYRYQKYGEPQYIIVNTGETPNTCIEGTECEFETNVPYANHYIACLLMKDEYGAPVLRVADSMCKDDRKIAVLQDVIRFFHYDLLAQDKRKIFEQIIAQERGEE